MRDRTFTVRLPGRWLAWVLVAMATAAVVAPVAVWASDRFTDVPKANVFHDDIGWLAAAGVTKGCNPPTNDEFCPEDVVTRQQMAAFMRRFAKYLGAEDGTPAQADNANTASLANTVEAGAITYDKLADDVVVARALGQVFHDGSVAEGHNLSSGNVTRPETGVYCISGLPFTPINAVVSNSAVFNAGTKDVRIYVIGTVGGDVCGQDNQIRIHVYSAGSATLSNGNFNIIIF